jgi:DNA-binding LacI/PurR family transcriptional regulator
MKSFRDAQSLNLSSIADWSITSDGLAARLAERLRCSDVVLVKSRGVAEDASAFDLARDGVVDAIFAASDLTAIGAIRAIERSGRRVFDDVAVVGFDDIAEAVRMEPALTTIRQPIADLGATMSQRLLERISGGEPPKQTILPVELIKRQTA